MAAGASFASIIAKCKRADRLRRAVHVERHGTVTIAIEDHASTGGQGTVDCQPQQSAIDYGIAGIGADSGERQRAPPILIKS